MRTGAIRGSGILAGLLFGLVSPVAHAQKGAIEGTTPVSVTKLSPTTLAFGNAIFGKAAAKQVVTLENAGKARLLIQAVTISGNTDFMVSNDCHVEVAAGASCKLTVSFEPRALGDRKATLEVRDSSAGSPHRVSLTGKGCKYYSPAAAKFFEKDCPQ